tara:strand:+ start:5214 stop:5513 length:300 start_codon:yes stop_codon:yes gene_type:complete
MKEEIINIDGNEYHYLDGGLHELIDENMSFIEKEWDKANDWEHSPLDIFNKEGMDEDELNEKAYDARQYWLEKYLKESNKIYVDHHGDTFINSTKLMEA